MLRLLQEPPGLVLGVPLDLAFGTGAAPAPAPALQTAPGMQFEGLATLHHHTLVHAPPELPHCERRP